MKTFYLTIFFFSFLLYTGSPSNSFFIKVLTLFHMLLHFCHSFSSSIKKADTLFQIKQQIMVQNDKKLCPLHSISQERYIIGLSFMTHMCKMIISAGFFLSFFLKFSFFGLSVGKRAKNVPKSQKILSVVLYISGTMFYVMSFMVRMCKMIISPNFF